MHGGMDRHVVDKTNEMSVENFGGGKFFQLCCMYGNLYTILGRDVSCLQTCPLHYVIPICNEYGVSRTANQTMGFPCLKPFSGSWKEPQLLCPSPHKAVHIGLCLFLWMLLPSLPPSLFPLPKHQTICTSLHVQCFLQLL